MSTNNTDTNNAIQRWSAVKSAIVCQRQRVMSEYSKARAQVLVECGQDIGLVGKPLVICDKPMVTLCSDADIKVAVGGGVLTSLITLQPADHWPGQLVHWEKVVDVLSNIDAEKIISAWSKATE